MPCFVDGDSLVQRRGLGFAVQQRDSSVCLRCRVDGGSDVRNRKSPMTYFIGILNKVYITLITAQRRNSGSMPIAAPSSSARFICSSVDTAANYEEVSFSLNTDAEADALHVDRTCTAVDTASYRWSERLHWPSSCQLAPEHSPHEQSMRTTSTHPAQAHSTIQPGASDAGIFQIVLSPLSFQSTDKLSRGAVPDAMSCSAGCCRFGDPVCFLRPC